jgi:hypothetical protein
MKKRDAEQQVIATARLVYLAWVGDTVDGGKAMREQLIELGKTFAVLDAVATHGNGYGPPKPCRWCGKLRPTCKDEGAEVRARGVHEYALKLMQDGVWPCNADITALLLARIEAGLLRQNQPASEADHLFSLLRELTEASKDYASSDPTLLSHDGVEFRFDAALEAAEEALNALL